LDKLLAILLRRWKGYCMIVGFMKGLDPSKYVNMTWVKIHEQS
jgi:hypothetical protein